jgi:hypothetical protein
MKKQRWIFGGYIFVCIVAALISPAAVIRGGLTGGAASYLLLMILLASCFGIMTLIGMKKEKR